MPPPPPLLDLIASLPRLQIQLLAVRYKIVACIAAPTLTITLAPLTSVVDFDVLSRIHMHLSCLDQQDYRYCTVPAHFNLIS